VFYDGICVGFEKGNNNIGFYFQIASKYLNSFMTALLNIIFDDFGTCIKV